MSEAAQSDPNAANVNQSTKPPIDIAAQTATDVEAAKDELRAQKMIQAFDQQIDGKAAFVPPTAADIAAGSQFEDDPGNSEPPRATAASRMKQKVRDVLDAQPFRADHIHKSDLIAVIDALIDGPDDSAAGY
jgi:hypothetical protein